MNLPRRSRWLGLLAAIAVIAVVAFAACKEDKGAGKTPTPGAGERIDGGTLTVASVEGDKLDPHQSSFATEISFERMLWRGPYTLAEDFVMAILRTCNPDVAGEYQYVLSNVVGCDDYYAAYGTEDEPKTPTAEELEALKNAVGVRATGDTTYEITLPTPQPTFTIILSLWVAFPVPVQLFPNPGDEWPAPAPDYPGKLAYNGPYIATEYEPGDHTTLVPNPNWVGDVKPTLDTLVLRFIDDFAVADRAYEAGEVDFANVNLTELSALRDQFEPTGEYLRGLKPATVGRGR